MQGFVLKLVTGFYRIWFNSLVHVAPNKVAKKAFDVFCTIRKGKVLPKQRSFLDRAKLEEKTISGHRIQTYRWKGTKGPVLLMHGWESNTFRWRNLIKKLQEHDFAMYAFDAPAHGNSSGKKLHVPLYAEVTRKIIDSYRPRHVVAHSIGGMTIHYTNYLEPLGTVEKIVTIGSPCEFNLFMDTYQRTIGFSNKVKETMDRYLKTWLGFHFEDFSSAKFVKDNTIKGLLFHDKGDKQVPYSESVKVNQHWKGSRLVLTEGLGHSMHQPKVNEQIIAFLEE